MASTAARLDIYNMALGFIGTRTIGSPNETCPEAIQCELFWDRARRSTLRDFPYNFAQRRVQLAEKELPEVYEGEWRHCYGWPDGALKVHRVHPMGREVPNRPHGFTVKNLGKESVIFTDVYQAQAECTFDVTNIDLWDDLFVMTMARKLACLIAVPLLKNNQSKLQELAQLYQAAIPSTDAHSASEEEERPYLDSWLAARGGW